MVPVKAGMSVLIEIMERKMYYVGIPNIYVMDEGRIIGQGNHKELSKNCFLYSKLVNSRE